MIASARRRLVADEGGFTLVEMLVAIVITGIISVPIGGAIFFGFRATNLTETRLVQSNHANVLASYFPLDVEGAITVTTNTTESTEACGASAHAADVLLTTGFDPPSSISYYQGVGPDQDALFRQTSAGGASLGVTRVASELSGPPAVNCFDAGGAPAACSAAATVQITLVQDNQHGVTYSTSLQGTRRVS